MMDIAGIDPEMHARHGDPRPLAKWIREGGAISDSMREFIADFLENATPPRGRGNTRTWYQEIRERRITRLVRNLRKDYDFSAVEAREMVAGWEGISADRVKQIVTKQNRRRKSK